MRKINKILIIIQRSNGDVLLSVSLINRLFQFYQSPKIDLLVNDDTYPLAKLFQNINFIHKFSYAKKRANRWKQEKKLILSLYKKYDLSINLTASDRSVIYTLLAGKISISAIEKDNYKSWWKKKMLTNYYFYDNDKHILIQNLTPLTLLNINHEYLQNSIEVSKDIVNSVKNKLSKQGIKEFIIFHPSAQYQYKIFPKNLRDELLFRLSKLGVPIIVTGSNNKIDQDIKSEILPLKNIFNYIGETTLSEYLALSNLSMAYIGMDTLNMHISASQNKRIFAIFGPTKLSMWSPWSNQLKTSTSINTTIQTYGQNTIFQSSSPCEVCGMFGCGSNHGKTEFNYKINPEDVFNEVNNWYLNRNV